MILYTLGDGEGVGREVADNKFYVFSHNLDTGMLVLLFQVSLL